MHESLSDRDASGDRKAQTEPGLVASTPRSVSVVMTAAVLVVVALVVLHLTGVMGPGAH